MKKITIEPTRGADTRSATDIVSKETLLRESHLHRSHVRRLLASVAAEVIERAERHDFTKVDPAGIDAFHDAFARTQRKEVEFTSQPWWERHLAEERHHLTSRLHADSDLLDLLEMIADCTCAGMARTGSVFPIEVPIETLQHLLRNTAAKMLAAVEVLPPPEAKPPATTRGPACEKCGGARWVWGYELDGGEDPPTDTLYPCDACAPAPADPATPEEPKP